MAGQIDHALAATGRTSASDRSDKPHEEANAESLALLDRILNDPNEPLDAERVWSILDRLANTSLNEPIQPAT
jgi:hypothetical protein